MMYQIQACSPQAKQKIKSPIDKVGVIQTEDMVGKYPCAIMRIGECFTVPMADTTRSRIGVVANYYSKRGKRFCVIKHDEHGVYELARIA